MKKLLLTAVVLAGGFVAANAEEVSYAPEAGSFSTEIQFNPFKGSSAVFSNGSSISDGAVFSGTYFVTNKFAVTFDLGLGGQNKKTVQYDDPTSDNAKVTRDNKNYYGTFTLGLGAKYYFYNYKRINLYCGAKAAYYHDFAGSKTQYYNDKEDVTSWTWANVNGDYKTGNGFGIYANTGIDFSIYKGLYVGAEINVGFKDTIYRGATAKEFANGVTETTKSKVGGHDLNGGFGVSPVFRLGWNF